MPTSSLPRFFNENTVVVERQQLEALLDRLPPPAEMRCKNILREACFDLIYIRRSNEIRLALTDHDWPHVLEALGLDVPPKNGELALDVRTGGERKAWLAGYTDAINAVNDHGLERARYWLRLLTGEEVHMVEPPREKEHPGGLG